MNSTDNQSILFIGAGNMGTSIASGLLAKQWTANKITFCDHDHSRHEALRQSFPDCTIVSEPSEATMPIKIVLLAVKPNDMQAVCQTLSLMGLPKDTLFISIAAGVPVSAFQQWLGNQAIIVRTMPNTPAAIGSGMTGLYSSPSIDEKDKALADQILGAVGATIWVEKETMLDAVTALSGSGPAYLFYLMECLQKSGKALGLNAEDSYTLTLQTMLGAAQLAHQQTLDFQTLRANVTSKGGTTEQAINCFIQNDMEKIVDSAVKAACEKASEISQSFNKE
ncbi:MAG: pyrroline-5-carboxylate reductase [Gammaproteobacteria bacterium]